jgi:prevent-host-death family protein
MSGQLDEYGNPKILHTVTTNELRDNLSQEINRAGFGVDPVLVTRRGRKIAAIISIVDLGFLERMKARREAVFTEELPKDASKIGPETARRVTWEIFFR